MNSYKEHYQKCKELYLGTPSANVGARYVDLYDVRLLGNPIPLSDPHYMNLIAELSVKVSSFFDTNKEDIMSLSNSVRVKSFKKIPEVVPLIDYIAPYLEERVFQSNLKVEHAHLYRSLPNTFPESSWVWHYDNCPDEYIKLGIYVNDVSKHSCPMQVMCGGGNEFYKLDTSALDNSKSGKSNRKNKRKFTKIDGGKTARAPHSFIEQIRSEQYDSKSIVGPRGTNFLFNPNILHRATVPAPRMHRDALFLFIRPSLNPVKYKLEDFEYNSKIDVKDYEYD